MFSVGSHGGDDISYPASPSQMLRGSSFNLPGASRASENSSPECSLPSSPRLDFFEPHHQHSNPFSLSLDTLELDSELGNFTASFGPFVEGPFTPCLPRPQAEADLTARWFETNQSCAVYGNGEPTHHCQPHNHSINQDFVDTWANLGTSSAGKPPFSRQHFSKGFPVIQNGAAQPPSSVTGNPTSEELSHYSMLPLIPHKVVSKSDSPPSLFVFHRVPPPNPALSPPNMAVGEYTPNPCFCYASLWCLIC